MLVSLVIKLPDQNYNIYKTKCVGIVSDESHNQNIIVDHFTVVCSVTWPLNGSVAEGDLVLIRTSLPLLCKSRCFNAN